MAGLMWSSATSLPMKVLISSCILQLALLWSEPGVQCLPANKTAFALLPKINEAGPYVGLVIPNPFELDPFVAPGVFVPNAEIPFVDLAGRRFHIGSIDGQKIIAVMCGLAMLNAGISTQQLLDFFDISGVLHYGIAGSASDSLNIGDVSIPKYLAHTGLWNWQRFGDNLTTPLSLESSGDYTRAFGALQVGKYNVPLTKNADNLLHNIWFQPEEVYAVTGTPEVRAHAFFVKVDKHYYGLAEKLTAVKLQSCSNGTCLTYPPKVVVGLRGGSQNVFVDNAAYRGFINEHFKISTVDMESAAVALVCLANDVPFIVFRSVSDLAGGSAAPNQIDTFSALASGNAVLVLRSFIKLL
ncbi:unnamed protein product [Calypogeia fissa]